MPHRIKQASRARRMVDLHPARWSPDAAEELAADVVWDPHERFSHAFICEEWRPHSRLSTTH